MDEHAVVRVRLDWRGDVHLIERPGPDVLIGQAEGVDVGLSHHTVADQHAKILIRRGRLILVELAGVVGIDGDRLSAPTTLAPDQSFTIGEISATASLAPPGLVGASCGGVTLLQEIDAIDPQTRRYLGDDQGRRCEITVVEPGVDAPTFPDRVDGRAARLERVPVGVSVARLLTKMREGQVTPTPELGVALICHLAQAISAFHDAGPHASVRPETVRLTLAGDVQLLAPGPTPMTADMAEAYCSATRRMNLPPAIGDDVFALVALARRFEQADLAAPLLGVKTRGAFRDGVDRMVKETLEGTIDASRQHVARMARLLLPPRLSVKSGIDQSRLAAWSRSPS